MMIKKALGKGSFRNLSKYLLESDLAENCKAEKASDGKTAKMKIHLDSKDKGDAARIEALMKKYLHDPEVNIGTHIDIKTGEFIITLSSEEWLAEDLDAVH